MLVDEQVPIQLTGVAQDLVVEPVGADVIDSSATMTGQTLDVDPYSGNYMVRINDIFGSYDATKISQTDAISQSDIDAGSILYVDWGAMLIDPGHPPGNQPFF